MIYLTGLGIYSAPIILMTGILAALRFIGPNFSLRYLTLIYFNTPLVYFFVETVGLATNKSLMNLVVEPFLLGAVAVSCFVLGIKNPKHKAMLVLIQATVTVSVACFLPLLAE